MYSECFQMLPSKNCFYLFTYLFIFCLEKFYVEHRDHSIQPIDWRGMGRTFQSDLWIRLWFLENGYFSILGCGVSTKKLILSLGGLLCVFKTTYSDGSDTRNSGIWVSEVSWSVYCISCVEYNLSKNFTPHFLYHTWWFFNKIYQKHK